MEKAELRKIYLVKQRSLTAAERDGASRRIAKNFFSNFDLASVHLLHCFLSIERFAEIDTTRIIHCIWKNHPQVRIVVPRVNFDTGDMDSVYYAAESETRQNRWLIPEPLEGGTVAATGIDMVLVPALCYDRNGHRVGYGKGFYDRFLVKCRPDCATVGLSYFDPVEKIDDVYDGDIALDLIVTPERVHRIEKLAI